MDIQNNFENIVDTSEETMDKWTNDIEPFTTSAKEHIDTWENHAESMIDKAKDKIPEYDWEKVAETAATDGVAGSVMGSFVPGAGTLSGGVGGTVTGIVSEIAGQTAKHNGASDTVVIATEIGTGLVSAGGIIKGLEKGTKEIAKYGDEIIDVVKNFDKPKMPIEQIQTRNQDLVGMKHPIVDVLYEKKIVDTPVGKIEGVFPKFESKYDYNVPKDAFDPDGILRWSDYRQFKSATEALYSEIEKFPNFAKQFSSDQIEKIRMGILPKEFTWHHKEDTGVLELVDSTVHEIARHTGGAKLWTGRHES